MTDKLSDDEEKALHRCYLSFRATVATVGALGATNRMVASAILAVTWEVIDLLPLAPRAKLLELMAHDLNHRITEIELADEVEEEPCKRVH